VQLPAAQTFDIQQVTQDCSCYQRRLLCADICGAHWQPDSEQVESQVESQDDLALAQSPVAQIFDSQQVESQKPKATAATSTFMQRFRFPYKFVSAQLTSSKGDEIFYPVNDDQDRQWAMRLDWAIDCHRNIAEDGWSGLSIVTETSQKMTSKSCMLIIAQSSVSPRKLTSGSTIGITLQTLSSGLRLQTRACAS